MVVKTTNHIVVSAAVICCTSGPATKTSHARPFHRHASVAVQFLKAFKRNDKNMAVGCLKFIAHLCNQQVVHEALALEIIVLLLDTPTDDSVEVALEFAGDVAALLEDTSSQTFNM